MSKKTNPRRRPASMADVNRAKQVATDDAITKSLAIFLTVMRDKEGYGVKRLKRVWDEIQDVSDSIVKGYINVNDLVRTLRDEAGIEL